MHLVYAYRLCWLTCSGRKRNPDDHALQVVARRHEHRLVEVLGQSLQWCGFVKRDGQTVSADPSTRGDAGVDETVLRRPDGNAASGRAGEAGKERASEGKWRDDAGESDR